MGMTVKGTRLTVIMVVIKPKVVKEWLSRFRRGCGGKGLLTTGGEPDGNLPGAWKQ